MSEAISEGFFILGINLVLFTIAEFSRPKSNGSRLWYIGIISGGLIFQTTLYGTPRGSFGTLGIVLILAGFTALFHGFFEKDCPRTMGIGIIIVVVGFLVFLLSAI
ncbi:MAG: hypothetical protein COV31_01040 [Candidatus Yanofskybacteria bacterium CG10_big_fil_rev_8_21_14_0_10_46_23]|uniref:Uncharacterized protein n=1 Tax=Candidatus Yanofskybacteria bacterium CG10_big_fil_rev_8_21_14_0_10_46_23 TaxID=1975098 RepID=A0A2H0R4K3_9BACT|nr:MAG: hypothetical protein COV31_01040 [Candidatus Yanofskybacteria bacterium CG10_big_fil_rev_8_21_14_0_10_46_23]